MNLIIITGKSGSGKSIALKALEDINFYCIDNLPVMMLNQAIKELSLSENNVAVSIDIRNLPKDKKKLIQLFSSIPRLVEKKILFLDASNNRLISRYSETKRLHPLSKKQFTLEESIGKEHQLLSGIKEMSDVIIDTTDMTVYDLNDNIYSYVIGDKHKPLLIIIKSFGFKYGSPKDADYIFDVRFLPNPHWFPELKKYTGKDSPVIEFFNDHNIVSETSIQIYNTLNNWLPFLKKSNRSYLTIAIGCTGGKHRSVYVAEQIAKLFMKHENNINISHSDILK